MFVKQNKTGMGLLVVKREFEKTLKVLKRKYKFGRFWEQKQELRTQIAASLYHRDTTEGPACGHKSH